MWVYVGGGGGFSKAVCEQQEQRCTAMHSNTHQYEHCCVQSQPHIHKHTQHSQSYYILCIHTKNRYGVKSQFQAIKLAGKGAAGDVWVCRNLRTKELVAIKFMKRPLTKNIQTMVTRELQVCLCGACML